MHATPEFQGAGCGDGMLTMEIAEKRPDLIIRGMDISIRPDSYIPVEKFNGMKIPAGDSSFDVVMLVDVLHHANNPLGLLLEAKRVSELPRAKALGFN